MHKLILITILLLLTQITHAQRKFTISGYIKDSLSTESLIGATIYNNVTNTGTSTNEYGFYSLTLPSNKVELVFSYIGYESNTIKFTLEQDTIININLTGIELLNEAVVTARSSEQIHNRTQMSAVNLPVHQVKSLPTLLGEVDLMKTIQLMPGVQSGNEGSTGLYVRGGGPDQNLILLDGVPVYNISHLFGFFSVFNADAINNVELIKGGFPARYGGRASSVIDINMKEGNARKFHGEGTIGLIAAKFTFEGPIWKDRTSFIISARRTYIDLLAKPFISNTNSDSGDKVHTGYYFYDLTAKINHRFSDKDRIYLSAYMGNDKFYLRDDYQDSYNKYNSSNDLKWGNITAAFRWNHIFNNKLFSNIALTYSRFRFNTIIKGENIAVNEHAYNTYYKMNYFSGIEDFGAKINFDYLPSPNHYIKFGGSITNHKFSPGAMGLRSEEIRDTTLGTTNIHVNEFTAFFEDDFRIGNNLKINAGVHWSGFYVNNKLYNDIQPRIAIRYLLGKSLSAKASYAHMAQYIHLLAHSGISLPMDLWVPSTELLKPQTSKQIAGGLAKSIKDNYEISLEGYYKWMNNLLEYKEGASYFDLDNRWENKILQGKGHSYGAELLIRKKLGKLSGWVGYTLSWSNREFEKLNNGKQFPYKFDRRHDISLVAIYKLQKNIELSGTWVYGTGNAITVPKALYEGTNPIFPSNGSHWLNQSIIKAYGDKNSYRMAAYHRLDLSISFIKKKKWGERRWIISVYNAYNRRNPFFIDIETTINHVEGNSAGEYLKASLYQYNLFPIIPSVSYNIKF